jgi:DNA polymerase-1
VDKVFYALAQTEQQLEPLKIETRLMELLWKIETRGLLIDVEYVKEQIAKSEKVVSQLEKEFVISSEQSVDIFSEESLKKLLYETWKLPVGRKTDKGEPAVDTWALERLRYDNPEWAPELKNLEEISSLNTMTRKFYAPLLENVKEDNYIFTRYNQMPKSGNISNMQTNIFQVSEEHAKEALRAFVVPEKKAWLIFDYSQIEMRILASYSRDERMVDVFARGGDLHQQTADLMKIDREVAKNLNYAMAYGWGLPQLARTAGITEEDARELKSFHRDAYPKAREFFKTAENKSAARGWVHTLSGKRRRFNDKFHKAAGLLVQGSSSDIFRKSLLEVDACLTKEFARDAELIAFSDGELIVEVEKGLEKRVAVAVAQTMKTIYSPPLVVPLGVDISLCRKNWVEREPFHREVLVAKPEPQEVEINEDSVELV